MLEILHCVALNNLFRDEIIHLNHSKCGATNVVLIRTFDGIMELPRMSPLRRLSEITVTLRNRRKKEVPKLLWAYFERCTVDQA